MVIGLGANEAVGHADEVYVDPGWGYTDPAEIVRNAGPQQPAVPKPAGGTTGQVQFGWDFRTLFPLGGEGGPQPVISSPSTTRAQSNTVLYLIAAGAVLFLIARR